MEKKVFVQTIFKFFAMYQSILFVGGLMMIGACKNMTRPVAPPAPTSSLNIVGAECAGGPDGPLTVTVQNNTNQTLYPNIVNFIGGFAAFIYYIEEGDESGLSTISGGCAEPPLYGPTTYTGTLSFTSLPPGLSVIALDTQGGDSCPVGIPTLCAISGTDAASILYSSPTITITPN